MTAKPAKPNYIIGINVLTFLFSALVVWSFLSGQYNKIEKENLKPSSFDLPDNKGSDFFDLYLNCGLQGKLDYKIFKQALDGVNKYFLSNKQILSIIDFSKPSTQKRLFIIDIADQKLLLETLVAHGKGSGTNLPTRFSNKVGSNQSSLGFFRTAETYFGKHGYSLMLEGLEKGINDNARRRAIVIHGAKYVSKNFIKCYNRLGRSWGCPAVSEELSQKIINMIKGGTCLFIYSDKEDYYEKSIVFNSDLKPHIQTN
jgi:L,D-transpeptidase catalytic domain